MKECEVNIFSGIEGFFFKTLPEPGTRLKILLALLFSFAPSFWFGALKITDPLHHAVYFYDSAFLNVVCVLLPLWAGTALLFCKYPPVLTPMALCCLAGAVLTPVFPSFTSLALSLTFLSASVWLCFDNCSPEFSRNKFYAVVPAVLFVFVFASGVEQQLNAYNRLILYYNDWGLYFAGYRKLAEAPFNGVLQWLSTGNHFNPAVNLLMSIIIRCFPGAETVFIVNSLAIASMVPLIFLLGRILQLPSSVCACCAAALAFNPLFSNQHTTLLYSYHPIIFLPSAFLLFCIAREKRSRAGMIIAGLFMCGIKETVFIFASGAAFLLALKKKWIQAGAVLLLCGGMFFLVTSVLLPLCDGSENYFQMFQYKSLGSSSGGLLLSPFLAPRVFWGKIFNPANLSFILLLLLPFFPAFRYAPRFLAAALPLALGVLLKDHYLGKPNIVQQYGVEISVWLTAAMIYGARGAFSEKRFSAGLAAALLIASLTGYYFAGKTPFWGTYSASAVRQTPDVRKLREHIKKIIPGSATVAVSMKWGAQLVESHKNLILDPAAPSADFTVLDFADTSVDMSVMMRVRDRFLSGGEGHPVGFLSLRGCQVVIFKKGKGPWQLPFIIRGVPEKILPSGLPLPVDVAGVRARAVFFNAQPKLLIFTAVEPDFGKDLALTVAVTSGTEKKYWSLRWGYGLFPAYLMKSDQSFVIELPLPRHWKKVDGLEIKGRTFDRPLPRAQKD